MYCLNGLYCLHMLQPCTEMNRALTRGRCWWPGFPKDSFLADDNEGLCDDLKFDNKFEVPVM
jgi:hypothetical protein